MRPISSILALAALLSPSLPYSSAIGGDVPKMLYVPMLSELPSAGPPKIATTYVKKNTWHETMRASLKATFETTAEGDRATVGSDEFRRVMVGLTADARPVRLALRVTGQQRLYFATLGPQLGNGAHFLSPRLFDKQGHSVELTLDDRMVEGKPNKHMVQSATQNIDGQAHSGFVLLPGEVGFKLDGKYERLEVLVCYNHERNGGGKMPPCIAIDCRPIVACTPKQRQIREALWYRVAGDFRDRRSQIEMEMEQRDGIWIDYSTRWDDARNAYYFTRARQRLELARKTLAFVEQTGPRPEMAAELRALDGRIEGAAKEWASSTGRDHFAQAAELRRRIIFSHPALDFDRLLLSKRPPLGFSALCDQYYGLNNGTGPGLVILNGWKTDQPRETVLLEGKLPPGCAMHPDLSFDGKRVVFAYADHTPPRERWQFFLYEIHLDGTGLRQITGTNRDPLAGAGGRTTVLCEDYDPCYLPDGGFAFISTRNQGGVRCHNGDRYCPTHHLYRCDADGSNVRQLSFGEANEWDPTVMPDGRILWDRWDYINRPVIPTIGLWTTRPDGTAAGHYFGNYTSSPCRVCQPWPIPGSHKVVATAAGHHTIDAGSLILIDNEIAQDGLEAITRFTPEATFPESEATSPVSFSTPFALSEDFFLAAHCPDPFPASMWHHPRYNGYGIYLVDTLGGRELIYRDPAVSCFAPIPVRPRPVPPVASSLVVGAETQANGVFYLEDVYRSTQNIPRGHDPAAPR